MKLLTSISNFQLQFSMTNISKLLFLIFVSKCISVVCIGQDVSRDKKLGAENAALVEKEMGIYYHDSLTRLINAVGAKLVRELKDNPFEYKFFLADVSEPNAFALPGGYVYVTRGILTLIQTEDELAGIMAHEIIHVAERHSVKQMKKGVIGGVLQIPGAIISRATGTQIGNVINSPIALTSGLFVARYSRGHERDADTHGIQLAAKAGYHPEALASALERLSKGIEMVTGKAEKHDYFSDHPLTPSRVADIKKAAPKHPVTNPSPLKKSKEIFQSNFNGLCFGPNPKQGVFKDTLFVHPDLRFSWVVPSKWKTVNKPASVGSFPEKGDAFIALSIVDTTTKSPKEIGEAVLAKAAKSSGVTVQSSGDTTINGNTAYLLRLKGEDNGRPIFLELLWLQFGDNVFSLASAFAPTHKQLVHQALCSFRKSYNEELERIVQYELRLVPAIKSETIGQMSERTGNKLTPALTAMINDLDEKSPLSENGMVKIIQSFPYSSR
jgi:predicted Zn-dependent protease